VNGGQRRESDLEAAARDEGFIEATHDVHLRLLVELLLAPNDRIVEDGVVFGPKTALEYHRIPFIEDVELRLSDDR